MSKECPSVQKDLLGLFLEKTEDAVLILDRKGCCIAANCAACALFGLSHEQLLHRSIADWLGSDWNKSPQISSPQSRSIQFQILRPDQTVRRIAGTVLTNNRLQQDLWLLHEITESLCKTPEPEQSQEQPPERSPQQLEPMSDPSEPAGREPEPQVLLPGLPNHLSSVFMQSAPIGMLVLDRQFRCIQLNAALAAITQMPIEEHLGKTIWDFVPGIAQQQTAIFEQVLATGQPVLNLEVTGELIQRPGVDRTWLTSYFPIAEPGAEPMGIGLILREVTDLKRIQSRLQHVNAELEVQVRQQTAELQQSLQFEATLKRITDKVRDSLDETQILQTAVEALKQALETLSCDTGLYDLEKGISVIAYESVQDGVPLAKGTNVPFREYSEIYQQLLSGQCLHACWLSARDTLTVRLTTQQFTMLAVPMMDEQEVIGDLWLYRPREQSFEAAEIRLVQQFANQCAIALRQSRLYQAAQRQVDELERLNRLKDDFLNTVSHELRTPMSNLKMAVQMLELHLMPSGLLTDSTMPLANYFRILSEECDREILLINDLLDLARLDAETELYQVEPIDLTLWLPHLAEVFQVRTTTKQQQFTLAIDPQLTSLSTDVFYLERIVVELLTNACKYTPAGETIQLRAQPIAAQIQIQVINTGIEIPLAERDRIFEKFYRIPNSDPWKHGGTGLGLALIQKIAHRLGGTIKVESGGDSGSSYTCFTVTLPSALQR